MKRFLDFAKNGAVVHFPAGTTNESIPSTRLGKLATVLSVVGSVAIVTPSTAEARGGGAIMGLIGGMMIGSMMSRGAIAAPTYPQQTYMAPAPVAPYGAYGDPGYGSYGNPGYGNPGYGSYGTYGVQGGQPGTYYCPRGPQHRCFWRGSKLETQDDLQKAAELNMDAAPAPRMG